MQILINLLVVLDTLILGLGVYMVVTAKPVRERGGKKNTAKGKDPVKAAFEFEVYDKPKKRGRPLGSKNKKASTARKENSAAVKKTSRRVV